MTINVLTYASAEEVASWLNTANKVELSALTAALINALNRIDMLEKQSTTLRKHLFEEGVPLRVKGVQ